MTRPNVGGNMGGRGRVRGWVGGLWRGLQRREHVNPRDNVRLRHLHCLGKSGGTAGEEQASYGLVGVNPRQGEGHVL